MKKALVVSVVFVALFLIGEFGIAQDFQTGDLEGTWYAYLSETNPVDGTYWLYGSFTIDDAGNVTGGNYTAPDGTVVNITGGTAALDNDGLMSGTITAEGGLIGTFPSGKLDMGKSVISFVGIDNTGSLDLGMAVKGGPPEKTGDDDGGGGGGGGGGGCFIEGLNQ